MTKSSVGRKATTRSLLLLVGAFAASCAAGYRDDDDGGSADYFRGHEPSSSGGGGGGGGGRHQLPVILMHKQALQEDGGFQYAFAADNGLRQGESIRPDGSRTGAYSYTDPDGKEISVKYTAGKDGFRIIQGDHVPKAPVSVQPLLQQPSSVGRSGPAKSRLFGAPGGPGSQFSRGGGGPYDSGEAYKPKYLKQQQQHYRVREDEDGGELPSRYDDEGPPNGFDGTGDYSSHSPFRAPLASTLQESKEQQPHTFGGGYAFEFGGGGGEATAAMAEF